MAVVNPFGDMVQGVLQGHAIAMQLRNQAMQEEAFQRSVQKDDDERQIRSLSLQQQMDQMGRRVIPGTNMVPDTGIGVTSQIQRQMDPGTSAAPAAGAPDTAGGGVPFYLRPNAPDTPAAQAPPAASPQDIANLPQARTSVVPTGLEPTQTMRPVDKSRVTTFKDPVSKQTIQWERYTPEEIAQREANRQASLQSQVEMAKAKTGLDVADMTRRATLLREGGGSPAQGLASVGVPDGTPLTRAEVVSMTEAAQKIRAGNELKLGQGEKLVERPGVTAAGGGQASVLASNAPKQTPEEDYADSAARKLGLKSRTDLSQEQWGTVLGQYKADSADPDAKAMMMATKQSALASANLSQALRQTQLDQAPTKEQAADIATDMVNHRLAPDQLSQIRGRGNGGLGLMVYAAAKKLDPEFSWEKASSEYQLAKAPTFQQNVRYMDSVQESIPMVIDRAKKLDNFGVKGIASLINSGKNQVNNIDLKKFQTDATLVSDEIGKILQGGGTGSSTSDAKLKQASEILGKNDSPKAIAAALGDVQELIGFRRKALTRGTYLENAAPAANGGSVSVTDPNGGVHQFANQAAANAFKAAAGIK